MTRTNHPKDRTKTFLAWLSDEEFLTLKKISQQQGLTKTALFRKWIHQGEPQEDISPQLSDSQTDLKLLKQLSLIRNELNPIGNNLNQITKVLNLSQYIAILRLVRYSSNSE